MFKLIVVGASGAGKSSLLIRFADDIFTTTYLATIGVDFKVRTVRVSDDKVAKLQIWDTAGQERFRTIVASYYRGAHGVMLVYDTTSRESFNDLESWFGEIRRHAPAGVELLLVGTKCDEPQKREVSTQEAAQWASDHDMSHIETSARINTNVEAAFMKIVDELHRKTELIKAPSTGGRPLAAAAAAAGISIGPAGRRRRTNCC